MIARLLVGLMLVVATASIGNRSATAATITVEYAAGHRKVHINDYSATALGTFTLTDGDRNLVGLCVEAAASHSIETDAYQPVANQIDSPELDALLWWIGDGSTLDDDLATAAGALAWYYSGALRTIGVPVWADGTRGFEPITPQSPEPWDALPPYTRDHPIGLRSNGADIDAAEQRVAELDRMMTAIRGPWTLTADAAQSAARLAGPGGAIYEQPVTFTVTPNGGAPTVVTAVTDADGWARPELPQLPDGGIVTATAAGPGVHREWDGVAGVQRMVTAGGSVELSAQFSVAALPRFVALLKRSTDPTLGVAGAEFALLDGSGAVVERVVTGADGSAAFAAIDPAAHPGPYAVRELVAPPGLELLTSDIAVTNPSTDPAHPSVIEVADQPRTARLRIRKQLSEPTGPADRSGFAFRVRRTTGSFEDELVTGPDGVTDELELPLGTYEVCESATPDWAAGFMDTGCLQVTVGLTNLDAADPIVVDYLNIVPTTTLPTTTAPTTTAPVASVPATTVPRSPSAVGTLPRTGNSDAARQLLRWGDIGFVIGVALIAAAGLVPARRVRRAG